MLRAVALLGVLGVALSIPATRLAALQPSPSPAASPSPAQGQHAQRLVTASTSAADDTPNDPSCRSVSSLFTDDWCAVNCAAGVCPPQTCRCGDALGAEAQEPMPQNLNLAELDDVDASTCISISPTATSYWCQLKCSNGRGCPEKTCLCEKAASKDGGRPAASAHAVQPKPWWRKNKQEDQGEGADEGVDPATEPTKQPSWTKTAQTPAWWQNKDEAEAEPAVAETNEQDEGGDPATNPHKQPSWTSSAQTPAWWQKKDEAEEAPATAQSSDGEGCPSYVSLAADVASAFVCRTVAQTPDLALRPRSCN